MPKIKMPKFSFPGLKGPEIDGDFDGPDIDINAPDVNLKGAKTDFEMPDVDFGGPSVKLKKPNVKVPDIGFSGPKSDAPNFDINSPDFDAKFRKGPKLHLNSHLKTPDLSLKGPKANMPNMDFRAPKLDVNTPDVNVGSPDAKLKMPKIKMPKGPGVEGLDASMPNVDIDGPKFKMPDLGFSGPKVKTPDMNLSGPKLKSPDLSLPNIDLPDANLKGPKVDLKGKRPDLGIKGDIGHSDMNFTAPQVKGGIKGPDFDINGPSGNFQRPQADLDLADKKFKLPSFKLPQFGEPDVTRAGSDIDFGASLTNLDISPPNAKLNMKPPELNGIITDPKGRSPNINLPLPKARVQNPQLKSPDLDVDNPSPYLKAPSRKTRRSEIPGISMRMPDLNVDDIHLHHTDRKQPKARMRSSYPMLNTDIDFTRSDLNIDDFTGKDHVLRARGSKLDLYASHEQEISTSDVNIDMRDTKHTKAIRAGSATLDSKHRTPRSPDGYYVTVFNQAESQKLPNRKYNTLGKLDFHPGDVDLEVPGENELKGSTFFFSSLI